MKLYTKDHEWVVIDGDTATFGITDHAQGQLGDIVFVEVPEVGRKLDKGGEAAVVESVKAASEVYAPVAGEVIASNTRLADDPGLVNLEPESGAWFAKLKIAAGADTSELMDEAAYKAFVASL
jgi:glycine cleavage system H protein